MHKTLQHFLRGQVPPPIAYAWGRPCCYQTCLLSTKPVWPACRLKTCMGADLFRVDIFCSREAFSSGQSSKKIINPSWWKGDSLPLPKNNPISAFGLDLRPFIGRSNFALEMTHLQISQWWQLCIITIGIIIISGNTILLSIFLSLRSQ